MPKQIQTPQPGQGLVRRFRLKGRYQPVLDETIVPVAIVPDPSEQGDGRIAQGSLTGVTLTTASAFRFFIVNPIVSNVLVTVQKVDMKCLTDALSDGIYEIHSWITRVDGLTFLPSGSFANTVGWRDSRQKSPPLAVPAAQLGATFANPVLLPANQILRTPEWVPSIASLVAVDYHPVPVIPLFAEVVLEPGWGFMSSVALLNNDDVDTFNVDYEWTELPQTGGPSFP